ncbi:hypothetical protein AHAS_Ahas20G0104900 [Arachis hypogaea]
MVCPDSKKAFQRNVLEKKRSWVVPMLNFVERKEVQACEGKPPTVRAVDVAKGEQCAMGAGEGRRGQGTRSGVGGPGLGLFWEAEEGKGKNDNSSVPVAEVATEVKTLREMQVKTRALTLQPQRISNANADSAVGRKCLLLSKLKYKLSKHKEGMVKEKEKEKKNQNPPPGAAKEKTINHQSSSARIIIMLRRAVRRAASLATRTALHPRQFVSGSASKPSLSIWRRKKEMGKEALIAAKELKRLRSDPLRLDRFVASHVSRLLKSDLVAVLAEFQRQDQVFLSMKLYDIVRKEIWYRPDMFFYRDMLMMLARNKRVEEAKRVWQDLESEHVLFDQHTFGDIIRAFLDSGLLSEAMDIYEKMRQSPEPPLSLPFRVILKGLLPYPELREKVKDDFLEIFPDMIIYDPPEDLFEDQSRPGYR